MPDSLSVAAEVRGRLRSAGFVLFLEDGALRYSAPPGALTEELRRDVRGCRDELVELLRAEAEQGDGQSEDDWTFTADADAVGRPFPLTDLQQAYLVGEQDFYDHPAPAVFVHEYVFPADAPPDADALDAALALLRRAHGALRLAVFPDGTQRILPAEEDAGTALIDRHDLGARSQAAAEAEFLALREKLAADLPPHTAGRPFLLRHITLPDGTVRLQIALRLTAFDGVTTQLFFTELARCCADPDHLPRTLSLSFRDYVAGLEERRTTEAHHAARRYWERRTGELSPAPPLPLRTPAPAPQPGQPSEAPAPQPTSAPQARTSAGAPLRRLSNRLNAATWARLRAHSAAAGLPTGTALFGLFVECLHRWSDGAAGLLTVLAAHRPGSHPEMPHVWGNASTTVLVGYGPARAEPTFAGRCRALQGGLYADLAALEVSGVEVSRLLQGRASGTGSPAPVVFTSGLDLVDGAPGGFLLPLPGAELAHSSISTPQILLDHQVYEENGELVCNFDYADSAYPPGMIEDLAAWHAERLAALAATPESWTRPGAAPLPADRLAPRRQANDTATELPTGELHDFVLRSCRTAPDSPAVQDAEGTLGRAALDAASAALAHRLRDLGVGRDPGRPDLVAVRVPRGRAQSIAALAVLRAGGAYVPVDPSWPAARVHTVLEHSRAHALIGDPWPEGDAALPDGVHLVPVANPGGPDGPDGPDGAGHQDGIGGPLDRTAYVIYTSGSTGTPKGVVIAHGAAVNTLRDLTDRFRLTARDKVLAVSSLAFDLSVFDQFGLLGCGGTVVCPPDSAHPDPQAWAETVHRHGVTVWNSVPALLALTLEYLGEQARELLAPLRLIMLSGDWVPPALVERLADVCPGGEVIAMGGATEASIWSNWFPAAELPADWQSVPYGTPLANQTMHVLDAAMADVPTWVPGDLYIGGAGLATAYLDDPERTAASFVHHPGTGERLYRTGDRARYRPGAILEFLGRADRQVKINGYRVELGEIEAQLAKLPDIRTAVALVDTAAGEPFLAAFVTRRGAVADPGHGGAHGAVRAADEDALRAELSGVLPAYMVPAAVLEIPELPLSGNGKVDRKALLALLADTARQAPAGTGAAATATTAEPPATGQESRLLQLWRELLGASVRGVHDDFFACGGNSLTAVRLFRRIETAFGRRLPLASLFRNRTVRAQAALLTTGGTGSARTPGDDTGPLVGFGGSGPQHVVLVHPVGGDVLCYREVVAAVETCPDTTARASLHGLRAAGLHQGEEPVGGLATMAKHYARTLLERLPEGPLHLVGWSMGGTVALHMAVLLEREGRPVTSLTTVDAFVGRPDGRTQSLDARLAGFFGDLTGRGDIIARLPAVRNDTPDSERLRAAHDALLAAGVLERLVEPAELARLFAVYRNNSEILERHTPVPWRPDPRPDGPSPAWLSIRAEHTRRDAFPGLLPLDEVLSRTRQALTVPEDHHSVVRGQAALRLADRIRRVTAAADAPEQPEGARA